MNMKRFMLSLCFQLVFLICVAQVKTKLDFHRSYTFITTKKYKINYSKDWKADQVDDLPVYHTVLAIDLPNKSVEIFEEVSEKFTLGDSLKVEESPIPHFGPTYIWYNSKDKSGVKCDIRLLFPLLENKEGAGGVFYIDRDFTFGERFMSKTTELIYFYYKKE